MLLVLPLSPRTCFLSERRSNIPNGFFHSIASAGHGQEGRGRALASQRSSFPRPRPPDTIEGRKYILDSKYPNLRDKDETSYSACHGRRLILVARHTYVSRDLIPAPTNVYRVRLLLHPLAKAPVWPKLQYPIDASVFGQCSGIKRICRIYQISRILPKQLRLKLRPVNEAGAPADARSGLSLLVDAQVWGHPLLIGRRRRCG